jgi:hypothetical protein
MQLTTKTYHTHLSAFFTSKPLYLDEKNSEKPNVRKLVEQPWQLIKGKEVKRAIETLTDLFFIHAKANAHLVDDIQDDFNMILENAKYFKNIEKIELYESVFNQEKKIIRDYPSITFQQLFNQLQWHPRLFEK